MEAINYELFSRQQWIMVRRLFFSTHSYAYMENFTCSPRRSFLLGPKTLAWDSPRALYFLYSRVDSQAPTMEFVFVPDQTLYFSLVTASLMDPYYISLSLEMMPVLFRIGRELCWINETAGTLPRDWMLYLLIHAVAASWDPGCHEWFLLEAGENKRPL